MTWRLQVSGGARTTVRGVATHDTKATGDADLARLAALRESPDAWSGSTALHFTGSAFVVHPSSRRVLLRWHEREQSWLQVGGHADPGETDALGIALREGREETGLEDLRPLDHEPVHVVIVPVSANAKEPSHEHADIRFVLVTDSPDAVRPETSAAELRWLTFDDAQFLADEPNVRESLRRVSNLVEEASAYESWA